jgi:hypothetical protein
MAWQHCAPVHLEQHVPCQRGMAQQPHLFEDVVTSVGKICRDSRKGQGKPATSCASSCNQRRLVTVSRPWCSGVTAHAHTLPHANVELSDGIQLQPALLLAPHLQDFVHMHDLMSHTCSLTLRMRVSCLHIAWLKGCGRMKVLSMFAI